MFYVGTAFSRFCVHTEDAFLCSMSQLHRYYLCGPSRAHFTLVLMINNTGSALMARADLRLFVTKDILYTSGAAKTWYIVPASDAVKVEVTAGKLGLSLRQLLRKDSMISPDLLKVWIFVFHLVVF